MQAKKTFLTLQLQAHWQALHTHNLTLMQANQIT